MGYEFTVFFVVLLRSSLDYNERRMEEGKERRRERRRNERKGGRGNERKGGGKKERKGRKRERGKTVYSVLKSVTPSSTPSPRNRQKQTEHHRRYHLEKPKKTSKYQ